MHPYFEVALGLQVARGLMCEPESLRVFKPSPWLDSQLILKVPAGGDSANTAGLTAQNLPGPEVQALECS